MIARTIYCLASNPTTEHLRFQLDQLHSEVDTTRRKANNARFRLLRLSEAAENLCRQAAKNVHMGKENDARELLRQKKKIMLALEKSKDRVQLLDELAAKLNEAISIKEAQLVDNVASDLEFGGDDAGSPVRIVPPAQDTEESVHDENNIILQNTDISNDQDFISGNNNETKTLYYNEAEDVNSSESISSGNEDRILSRFRGVSSYIDFLERLDRQFSEIEEDLVTILDLSTLVLKKEDKPNNSRMQQVSEILENIRGTRVRIQQFMQKKVETK